MAFKFNWLNDQIFNISRGVSKSYENRTIQGENTAVATTLDPAQAVWTPGGEYLFQDTSAALTIKSSDNTDDTIAGAGLQRVQVRWLDDNGIEQLSIIDMNGTTAVAIGTGKAVNSVVGVQGGVNRKNTGIIQVLHGGAIVLGQMEALRGQALQAVFTVPSNKECFIFGGWYTSNSLDQTHLEFYYRLPGGVWVSSIPQVVFQTASSLGIPQVPFRRLPPGTQFQLRAFRVAGGSDGHVTGGVSFILKNL